MNRTFSFKTYLVGCFILVTIVPIIAVGSLSLDYLTRKTTKSIEIDNQLLADAVGWEIRGQFQQAKSAITQVATFLRGHRHGEEEINQTLSNALEQFQYFESIYLLDDSGQITHAGLPNDRRDIADEYINLDMSHLDSYKKVKETQRPVWSDAFLSHITGKLSLTLTVPVSQNTLVANFSIEHLHDRVEQIQTKGGPMAMIVDKNGILIFHPDSSKSKEKISLRHLLPVQVGIEGQKGTHKYIWNQAEHIGSVAQIPETGWILILSQTTDTAYSSIRQMQKFFIAGIVLAILAASALAIALTTRLTKPLAQLQKSAGAIASGDYNTKLPESRYLETVKLAGSFENMAASIMQREHEREKLLKTLAGKNEELESIIYASSHDLRSPLVNIHGFAGELEKDCRTVAGILRGIPVEPDTENRLNRLLDDDIPSAINFIKTSSSKLDSLQKGLLRLCRLGRENVTIIKLDMNKIVDDVIKTMQHQINELNADVIVEKLPPCLGDKDKVNQVFSNLVENALKYRHPERQPLINISGQIENDHTVYTISDNGRGIKPDYQQKIFEIFHRLDPDSGIGGEGLGLTIVKRTLDRLDGMIKLKSKPEKGTIFFVSLPRA